MSEHRIYRYQFTGSEAIHVPGIGDWQPKEIKEIDHKLNHPELELLPDEDHKESSKKTT